VTTSLTVGRPIIPGAMEVMYTENHYSPTYEVGGSCTSQGKSVSTNAGKHPRIRRCGRNWRLRECAKCYRKPGSTSRISYRSQAPFRSGFDAGMDSAGEG